MSSPFRAIPAMDKCLAALYAENPDFSALSRNLLKDLATAFWNRKREVLKNSHCAESLDLQTQLPALSAFIRAALAPRLKTVLNGTGIVIHTNLGRSLLSKEACEAMQLAAQTPCNLELNLNTGERGSRQELVSGLICKLTDAQDAMVVNNNAAAVLLILDTLCAGGETIVSRGELVEIGGSFRIPDIMRKSGSLLKEVGTTNRTHPDDYVAAINENTKAIMRVHASNFRIVGFQSSVPLPALKKIAEERNLPLIFDLGSGNLLDFSEYGLPPEPTVKQILAEGADIVCFSGDKALGGPQAGIIAGKRELIAKMKKNPLARALRCDKLCLAALEATLRAYLDPQNVTRIIPTAKMIAMPMQEIARNARALAKALRHSFGAAAVACDVKLANGFSQAGGGSFPEQGLPTTLISLEPKTLSAQELRQRLLAGAPPLLGRLEKNSFRIDPRTLPREDFPKAVQAITAALKK